MTESIPISKNITQGPSRAGARAMYRAAGFDADACANPSSASPIPGPSSALQLWPARPSRTRQGRHPPGRRHPLEFNTVVISDGITMGTEGMKTSLISREVIADSMDW